MQNVSVLLQISQKVSRSGPSIFKSPVLAIMTLLFAVLEGSLICLVAFFSSRDLIFCWSESATVGCVQQGGLRPFTAQ